MNRILPNLLLLMAATTAALGQSTTDIHQRTTTPPEARFEIVQSQVTAMWTFRLDRFTGNVAQLVQTADNGSAWEAMEVVGLPRTPPSRARFQLFTSGIAARHTFLMDTDTGRTWVIVRGKRKGPDGTEYDVTLWTPFPE